MHGSSFAHLPVRDLSIMPIQGQVFFLEKKRKRFRPGRWRYMNVVVSLNVSREVDVHASDVTGGVRCVTACVRASVALFALTPDIVFLYISRQR